VSNKAIQEVVAGMKYYDLKKGIVVTNNYFTKSAIELGNSNDVVLWDRVILKEKISEYY
jgi:restriction system protein